MAAAAAGLGLGSALGPAPAFLTVALARHWSRPVLTKAPKT